MQSNNVWMPGVLTVAQGFIWVVALTLLNPLLPSDVRSVIQMVPNDILRSLSLMDEASRQFGKRRLDAEFAYLGSIGLVWLWIASTVGLSFLGSWIIQLLISGLQPAWRYLLGISLFALIWAGCFWFFHKIGTAWFGQLVGFMFGQFFGWWAAIGYRKTDQRHSDARTVRAEIGTSKPFHPLRYINLRKGIFVGLDKNRTPKYIKLADARKHCQLMGETRNGKTVAATLMQAQSALIGETVITIDPKGDKYSPGVAKAAAERAGIPFIYIDLRPENPPQLNPLSGASPHDIEELLISCFDMGNKGTDADVYRVEDRAAARKLARSGAKTFNEMIQIGLSDESISNARKFWEDLQELASHPAIQTKEGWKLEDLIGKPCFIYIVGSTRHDNTIRLQKLTLLRLLQLIDKYGIQANANWTSLFIDEFKYLLSPAALRALGTVADRNCHLIIAHQSLGDLRDIADLDPGAVYGAVVVNTGLKLFYKTNDPDTAKWAADLSGDIPTYTESISKSPATANPGSFQEKQRPLFEKNVLLALPPLTDVLFGSGVAKMISVHYLPTSTSPPRLVEAPQEQLPIKSEELI